MSLANVAKGVRETPDSLKTGNLFILFDGNAYDGYDKTATKSREGVFNQISGTVKNLSTISDSIEKAVGSRNPMYIIGQVDKDQATTGTLKEKLMSSGIVGQISRAVGNFTGDVQQTGVIIDGFADIQSTIDVNIPNNPVMYKPNISDQRVRTPDSLTMTVLVSNLLNDDIIDDVIQTLKNTTAGVWGFIMGEGESRAQQKLRQLRYIQENGSVFKVYTPHMVYENMLIKSIKTNINSKNMGVLMAQITFTEIIMCRPIGAGMQVPGRSNVTAKPQSTLAKAKGLF
jgi:hypothetical protein